MKRIVLTAFLLLACEAAAAERVLVFDDVRTTDLQANFQCDCVATQPPSGFQKLQRVPTKSNAFFLYFDPSLTEPARFGKFFDYTFYVFRLENGAFKRADAIFTGLRDLSTVSLGPGDTIYVADEKGAYQFSLKTKKLSRFDY